MRRISRTPSDLGLAPWIVAGVLLLATDAPDTSQDVAAAPIAIGTEASDTPTALSTATAPLLMAPAAGVGPGLASEGTGPLGIGALVGALVAGGAALRERFKAR